MKPKIRIEGDSLGEKKVPASADYGIETMRALENFPISGMTALPVFIKATGLIKKAAALTNMELGELDRKVGKAIVRAADEIIAGKLRDQFVVDVFQAGAGTSHNMNANEVIANRAIELLGGKKGDYQLVHPHDQVNKAQSTNDVYPTAMRIASLMLLAEVYPVLDKLAKVLDKKGKEFDTILKSGRTHLQDAVPIRLGQEFTAYARTVRKCNRKIQHAAESLLELNIGATAVGTGFNADPRYIKLVVNKLSGLTGFKFKPAANLVEITQNTDAFLELSSTLRILAVDLIRIANDLRLMSSGPRTGLNEIRLPAVQPGSSIMPGKVNPVLAEMLDMVCFQVIGNDTAIAYACQAGQLELNVMMPIITHNLLQSITILKNAVAVFTDQCVNGIKANREQCRNYAERSLGLATALNTYLGYESAAKIAQEALHTGKTIREVVLGKKIMTKKQLEKLLNPKYITKPGIPGKRK
jgi:aspartate ammonia-lyase